MDQDQNRTRGVRHLWLPRRPPGESTGRLLLVALAADRATGHPDNVAATARLLRATEPSIRAWRASALADGLLVRTSDGRLVPGPNWPAWEQATDEALKALGSRGGWDPLPRAYLRRGRRPATLHAAAAVYADAVGWQATGAFVRGDHERASRSATSIPTVRSARRDLEAAGLITVERLRRGRATLTRAKQADGMPATHGAPMTEDRATTLANRASRARTVTPATPRTPKPFSTGTPKPFSTHHQEPTVPYTIRATSARFDGRAAPEDDGRTALARWLATPGRAEAWIAMSRSRPQAAVEELLALTKAWDLAPRRRTRLAGDLARTYRRDCGGLVLAVCCDLLATTGRNRPRRIGAVLALRVAKLAAGKATDGISERHRTSTVQALLAEARGAARVATA